MPEDRRKSMPKRATQVILTEKEREELVLAMI
jgi:hypothetical protein